MGRGGLAQRIIVFSCVLGILKEPVTRVAISNDPAC
jgi:hypothetical protein